MEMVGGKEGRLRQRLILKNFLTDKECKELEFIHKSSSTVGYRLNVFSTTLSHLVATNSHHLIMPFVPIRERLKEKAEEFFGCEFELFVEFTGLISWSKGASIGWHSDDNRPYLKQRDYTAVCYLNSYGIDFKGGLFHFQDGKPESIIPLCGDVVMYTADDRNIHSVEEITGGERLTLSLWFSRDATHDEDAKLISLLSESLLHDNFPNSCLPLPASSNMYWYSPNQASNSELGFDICWARLHLLGYDIYVSREKCSYSDSAESLMGPLRLVRGDELFDQEFANILHALQVVQYHCWKTSEFHTSPLNGDDDKVIKLSTEQQEEISRLKSVFLKYDELAEAVFGCSSCDGRRQYFYGWTNFAAAAAAWEDYACKLHIEMLRGITHWKAHQSIFNVSMSCS